MFESVSSSAVRNVIDRALEVETGLDVVGPWLLAVMKEWPHETITLFQHLCYETPMIRTLYADVDAVRLAEYLDVVRSKQTPSGEEYEALFGKLGLLLRLLHHALLSMDDQVFVEERAAEQVLSTAELKELSLVLRDAIFERLWSGPDVATRAEVEALDWGVKVLEDVVRRDSRLSFTGDDPASFWVAEGLEDGEGATGSDRTFARAFVTDYSSMSGTGPAMGLATLPQLDYRKRALSDVVRMMQTSSSMYARTLALLSVMPYAVPFEDRVFVLRTMFQRDAVARPYARHAFSVRRDRIVEDGFAGFSRLGDGVKDVLKIQFVDVNGEPEAGVDGGGLFKEFMNHLVKAAYSPDYGLFCETPESHRLYPNPHSSAFAGNDREVFSFLGAVVGKALYEGVLVELPLADFFIRKMLGISNHVYDMASLDSGLYTSLMRLKYHEPGSEVESWGITFALDEEVPGLGARQTVELIRGGSEVPVTGANRAKYVYLVAQYKLNRAIAMQSKAFMNGLASVVPRRWLTMFAPHEFQTLLSGSESGVDVENWAECTAYGGGYDAESGTVRAFWEVVSNMDAEMQSKLLMFATSCSRPPLLGFTELNPRFCIHRAGDDRTRLPTAATCMNLLKLPDYGYDVEVVREKLVYALESGAGFGLS